MINLARTIILLILVVLVTGQAMAERIPARPDGAHVVPEQHLRAWDPVTIFFDEPTADRPGVVGPEASLPVDLEPDHPGVFIWLDERTLQFRPVEPWPPLARFSWRLADREVDLTTLMSPAVASTPADGAHDLAGLDSLVLAFRDPIDPGDLAEMIEVRVLPLPGVDVAPLARLDQAGFELRALERSGTDAAHRYRLRLHQPIGEARVVELRLRLSLSDDPERAFQVLRYTTRSPFRPLGFGCPADERAVSADGVVYPRDQAVECRDSQRGLTVRFSAEPATIGPAEGRNLVRLEPAVDNLEYRVSGQTLRITGDFSPDTLYRMVLSPTPVEDRHGRALKLDVRSEQFIVFPAPENFLTVNRGRGTAVMERFGPRSLPLRGRGDERVDLRIHRIEPDDPDFWPWSEQPVSVEEDARPPGPGEEPERASHYFHGAGDLARQLHALGTPAVSELIDLPLAGHRETARFGLDLDPFFERIDGPSRPGTYLVGVRRPGRDDRREWVRVQVTDLSLSVVEAEDRVRFFVTRLSDGRPVEGARVRVQAASGGGLRERTSGRTDGNGAFDWRPSPGRSNSSPVRIAVDHDDDHLSVDVAREPPPRYFRGQFSPSSDWLGWTSRAGRVAARRESAAWHCHLFTERPVYRPGEKVHVAGFVRRVHRGRIESPGGDEVRVIVQGPDGSEWRQRVELDAGGSFHEVFERDDAPSGQWRVSLVHQFDRGEQECARVSVEKSPYRIPTFEVQLDGPRRTGLDRPFEVDLSARFYAGGMVRERPVRWRVTRFPETWQPSGREGFAFSTDARFAGEQPFDAEPASTHAGQTDAEGRAVLEIDPTREGQARALRYVVEATVTGDDDQTVTDTFDVRALPPFVLGLQAPRYLEHADSFTAEVIALDHQEDLLAGNEIELSLVRRRWAARLKAGDFSANRPRYSTEVVDEVVAEKRLISGDEPLMVDLPLADTGVYLLRLTARDALGRAQHLELDLFNSAETRATWPEPPAPTFEVVPVHDTFAPGETAELILKTPLASGRVLAIAELPDGRNDYRWLEIEGGRGRFELDIEREFLPGVPVHFLLLRGRVDGPDIHPARAIDPGRPIMMAASHHIDVDDRAHRVDVELSHPDAARPGEEIDIEISLEDLDGDPLAGRVTLWLVDRAVLALGEEQALDPLPDFLRRRDSRSRIRDTRNQIVGELGFVTEPGGDGPSARADAQALLDSLTVRDTFESVPFFRHGIEVDERGHTRVTVQLPDDLTEFMIRAKVAAGTDRFGHAGSRLAVRQSVIAQPVMPSFVRYGDRVDLAATTRVVDERFGEGTAAIELDGLASAGPLVREMSWPDAGSQRLVFPVEVPIPERWPGDPGLAPRASVRLGVQRASDDLGDAFAVEFPVLPDRAAEVTRRLDRIEAGERLELPAVEGPWRPGSLRRELILADQPAVLSVLGGLDWLLRAPEGGLGPRVGRARALLAARSWLERVDPDSASGLLDRHVASTLALLDDAALSGGGFGHWPGSAQPSVAVSSAAMKFLVEAESAGFSVAPGLRERLRRFLQGALRGEGVSLSSRYFERTLILLALARAGELDAGYAAELARRAQFLRTESIARVAESLAVGGAEPGQAMRERLEQVLLDGLVFELADGEPVYSGLQLDASALSPALLPSEVRTLARVLRALAALDSDHPRLGLLADVLLQLGHGGDWGSPDAGVEAVLALVDRLEARDGDRPDGEVLLSPDNEHLVLGGSQPVRQLSRNDGEPVDLHARGVSVGVLERVVMVPDAPGSQAPASADGFVVERAWVRFEDGSERRQALDEAGVELSLSVGELVEDRVRIINPEARHHVVVSLPLAAGMEALDPSLDTAPPEARPALGPTRAPDFVDRHDERVDFHFETLPAGTFELAVRTRAAIAGEFSQPSARAVQTYRPATAGQSPGARVMIRPAP